MPTYIIDGKKLAAERERLLKIEVEKITKKIGRRPKLAAVELADDEGSRLYLKLKRAAAERIGIDFQISNFKFPARLRMDEVQAGGQISNFIDADGIFIQHPRGFDKQKWQELVDKIPPEKDVDCLTSENLRLIKEGKSRFLPATVKAVLYCLERSHFDVFQGETLIDFLENKKVVILGRSPMVGLPLFWWLKSLGADISVVHSGTSNEERIASCLSADILISSVGKPGIITGNMVKKGAVVIDCGSPLGDVVFDEVALKVSAITPVPGGVGPLTVVSLMENVVKSAKDTYAKKR